VPVFGMAIDWMLYFYYFKMITTLFHLLKGARMKKFVFIILFLLSCAAATSAVAAMYYRVNVVPQVLSGEVSSALIGRNIAPVTGGILAAVDVDVHQINILNASVPSSMVELRPVSANVQGLSGLPYSAYQVNVSIPYSSMGNAFVLLRGNSPKEAYRITLTAGRGVTVQGSGAAGTPFVFTKAYNIQYNKSYEIMVESAADVKVTVKELNPESSAIVYQVGGLPAVAEKRVLKFFVGTAYSRASFSNEVVTLLY
jgi:hypothetical protein